jgi:ribosome assembly protein 1
MAPPKTKGATRGTVHGTLFDGLVTYTLRASPLPEKLIEFLLANTHNIGKLVAQQQDANAESEESLREEREAGDNYEARSKTPEQFWAELESLCEKVGGEWAGAADRIWCFGPKRIGANLLLDPIGKTVPRYVPSQRLVHADSKLMSQTTPKGTAHCHCQGARAKHR